MDGSVIEDHQLSPDDADADEPVPLDDAHAVVYWRPGCPFCAMLRAGLRLRRVPFREVNIWHDPEAAAFVRSVARGNETVPTVTVGSVSLVNPSAHEVADLVAAARG
ncbi:MAG: glutaredoxin domain-containing protein [Ilumatobacteraceae bacterium]